MRIILLCALFLATLGTILYQVKTGIDIREDRLATLESEISKTKREVAVLEAEWAYLSRPERVMELSDRLLGMRPIARTGYCQSMRFQCGLSRNSRIVSLGPDR